MGFGYRGVAGVRARQQHGAGKDQPSGPPEPAAVIRSHRQLADFLDEDQGQTA
jgi:hypothetical protein